MGTDSHVAYMNSTHNQNGQQLMNIMKDFIYPRLDSYKKPSTRRQIHQERT